MGTVQLMSNDLKSKSVIVLGSTSEIGAAVARRFAEAGARVVINGRRKKSSLGPQLTKSLKAEGLTVEFVAADMSDPSELEHLVQATFEMFGSVDVMVVCGRPRSHPFGSFLDSDPRTFLPLFNDIVVSRLLAAHAAGRVMAAQGKGKIVFVTSDVGRTPTPGEPIVGAAAAATIAATRHLAYELRKSGIRVNTVAVTLTAGTQNFEAIKNRPENLAQPLDPRFKGALEKIERRAAFGLATADDIANAVMFFAGDASDKISGATISVNGGVSFPAY